MKAQVGDDKGIGNRCGNAEAGFDIGYRTCAVFFVEDISEGNGSNTVRLVYSARYGDRCCLGRGQHGCEKKRNAEYAGKAKIQGCNY
jgi:hypothetical protein